MAKEGKRSGSRSGAFPVQIKLLDEKEFIHQAKLDFVDNEIDGHSGTIESRAVLQNIDHMLEPGMFGKARLSAGNEHHAIRVPDEIIGTDQSLRFVYIIGDSSKVEIRKVKLGPLHVDGMRIIREGLDKNDVLILNNLQKLRPGLLVSANNTKITRPEDPASSK